MSLAVRLLLGLAAIASFVTAVVGLSAREVSRHQVERGFRDRLGAASRGARAEILHEAGTLANLLPPLCRHDTPADRALVDLEGAGGKVGALPVSATAGLQAALPAQAQTLRLDRLRVVTGDGIVLATADGEHRGALDPALATRLHRAPAGQPRMIRYGNEAHLEVHCTRVSPAVEKPSSVTGEVTPLMVGVVASRHIQPLLKRIGRAYGVALTLDPTPRPAEGFVTQALTVDEVPGMTLHATLSRQPLYDALARVDASMLLSGALGLLLSVALAVLLARGLSRPIEELAQQTRAVVRGEPRPVEGRGGREMRQLARSFNRALEELSAMRNRLARTERIAARREVARQVAHEIKNPLSPIRASMENLRRLRDRKSPKFDTYFDEATKTVLEEVHRIKRIVDEFTEFARMPPPQFGTVDLADVVRAVAALHDTPAASTGQVAHVRVAPVEGSVDHVAADRDQITRVVTNLVQNGVEAARDAGRAPEVVIRLHQAAGGHEVRIDVDDNGPGIPADMRDRIFEPYVTTKRTGNGLGLAIVQTIVHEHGGEIQVAAAPAPGCGGARLSVTLPVAGPPLLEQAPLSVPKP
ncbi:MAG: ATP-binding protein [Myxococcota bacterium]